MKKKITGSTKVHIKIGEKVKVISGKDKGKIGLVKKILKQPSKVIVEGINIKVKHIKPTRSGESGEIKRLEFPIHSSNVSIIKE